MRAEIIQATVLEKIRLSYFFRKAKHTSRNAQYSREKFNKFRSLFRKFANISLCKLLVAHLLCETSQDVEEGRQKTGIPLKRGMGKQHKGTVNNSIVEKNQGQKVNDRTFGSDRYKFNIY